MNETTYIHTDGGSRGNPGESAVGVVLVQPSGNIVKLKKCIGIATNNIAEYAALKEAIILAKKLEAKNIHVFSDSKLMVNQIKGLFMVKDEKIRIIYDEIIMLIASDGGFDEFHISYCPREHNTAADALVNEALDAKMGKTKGKKRAKAAPNSRTR